MVRLRPGAVVTVRLVEADDFTVTLPVLVPEGLGVSDTDRRNVGV